MSWESIRSIAGLSIQKYSSALGKLHSARIVLYSFDFEEIAALPRRRFVAACATEKMVEAGEALKNSRCVTALAICTNTMHMMADDLENGTQLPLIHIIDSTAEEIKNRGLHTLGLLGTAFTMEQPFYRQRFEKMGIRIIVPEPEDRKAVHDIIYNELCKGIINPDSRKRYVEIMGRSLKAKGARGHHTWMHGDRVCW